MNGNSAPVVIFIGQPNCGKSTLFNAVAGYKAQTSNFPGTTVKHTHSLVNIEGRLLNIIDLPGTYSLHPADPAEKVALRHLFLEKPDIIINVVDASILGRSLELTLELIEMEIPMVVALNMTDSAEKKGITIDAAKLQAKLGVPVIPTVAVHGRGLKELMEAAMRCLETKCRGARPRWSLDVERIVEGLTAAIPEEFVCIATRRFTAVQMLESGNLFCEEFLEDIVPGLKKAMDRSRAELKASRGLPAYEVIAAERHHLSQKIFEDVSSVRRRKRRGWGERLDDVFMHPVLGYPILLLVFLAFFLVIFKVGEPLEQLLIRPFTGLRGFLAAHLGGGLAFHLADGFTQGVGGGVAIVLPYFVPLLFLMALLEDVGYLARAGFLLDTFMHRIGLHGKSVSPFILGFGCNVPAIVSTRILESRRDRILTSLLIPFIPCSARTTVILALVAFFLGPYWALGFYLMNVLILAVLGWVLSLFFKTSSPGLILEIPTLKMPRPRNVGPKVYFQLKSFVAFAWPLLIAGSVVLGLIQSLHWDAIINTILSPLVVGALGLPRDLGVTLVFGFLRKELSLLMMLQSLGVSYADLLSAVTRNQLVVFTVFINFFIPCLSTFAILWKEMGKKIAFLSATLSITVAVVVSLFIRLII